MDFTLDVWHVKPNKIIEDVLWLKLGQLPEANTRQ